MNDPELPADIRKLIERTMDEGVTYSLTRPGKAGERMRATAIHWRPGKPNALAAAIIKRVHGPMPLELDGHWYTIAPGEEPT